MIFSGVHESLACVLVSPGTATELASRWPQLTPPLAQALAMEMLPALAPLHEPDRALGALVTSAAAPALAALPLDPGFSLADGSCWAQALGAWRQPTLLVIAAHQLESGAAAATTALLRQHGVPLLGLIQWGDPWQLELRRRDGLPWLGALGAAGQPQGIDLRLALARQVQGFEA
jgi:hypothetical protein